MKRHSFARKEYYDPTQNVERRQVMFAERFMVILQQAPLNGEMVTLTVLISFVAIGASLGTVIALLYTMRMIQRTYLRPTQEESIREKNEEIIKLVEEHQKLDASIGELRQLLKELESALQRLEVKATSLESRVTVLEKRASREALEIRRATAYSRPSTAPPQTVVHLKELGEVPLYFPEVSYVGIITSQGYIVESYGRCSEEPPKLLEVLRMSGTDKISLIRGDRRLEVFYLGDVRDLSAYGILEFKDGGKIEEERVSSAKEAINKYFRDFVARPH